MSGSQALPYELPETTKGKISALSELVGIPRVRFKGVNEQDALKALSGLILYRHLSRQKEREINEHWAQLPRDLQISLRKRRNFILVNPSWGIWSLSTEELRSQAEMVQRVSDISQIIGLGGLSITQFNKVFHFLSIGRLGGVASLLLIGSVITIKHLEGKKINAEIIRRLKEEGEL